MSAPTLDPPAPVANCRGDYNDLVGLDFDWRDYLGRYDPRLLASMKGRRAIGRYDPVAFALLYFRHQLQSSDTGNQVSFSPFHAAAYEWALSWIGPQEPMDNRHAWVAPRGGGKSAVFFRILPVWAMAYRHKTYFAIFTRASDLAVDHMTKIRQELRSNELLRHDFPRLCEPRKSKGHALHDSVLNYMSESGAIITARGMDSSVLGASIDGRRADVIVLDDVENSESNYSVYQAQKRLRTITGAIAFYNTNAIWAWVGTTTMRDGLVHNLVRSMSGRPGDALATELQWVRDERIRCHHFKALVHDPESGEWVSTWPQRWSTEHLLSIRHGRTFAMEMQNDPAPETGGLFEKSDFTHAQDPSRGVGRCALFLDPPTTVGPSSDYCGISISQHLPATREQLERGQRHGTVEVLFSQQIRLTGAALANHVAKLLNRFPEVRRVVVERNQGGAMWLDILGHLPVKVETFHSVVSKDTRGAEALSHYQARPTRVVHVGDHTELEGQLMAYPDTAYDDLADASWTSVNYWLNPAFVRDKGIGSMSSTESNYA